MRVFWDVDTQVDFMDTKAGKLSIPKAYEILSNLGRLTRYALQNDILILGSVDRHFEDDEELKKFPPHCMNKTDGQRKILETSSKHMAFISSKVGKFGRYEEYSNDEINIITRCYNHILFEKQHTDVFTNRNVIKFLDKLRVSEAVVYGVATDYCVKDAVLGLLKLGIKVYLVVNATKGISESNSLLSVAEMVGRGAILTNTKEETNESDD